jgi:DNA end-binding protein Ku
VRRSGSEDGAIEGIRIREGQYLVITEKELTESEPAAAKVLELSAFVPANQLDPIFFESCYYLAPLEGGQKPYALVREAMLQSNLVGIARIVKNSREHICVVRPYGSGLIIHTLYWINEVRAWHTPRFRKLLNPN